jgi:hypothetical protein
MRGNSIMERWIGSCRRELLDRTEVTDLEAFRVRRRDRVGGVIHEYQPAA